MGMTTYYIRLTDVTFAMPSRSARNSSLGLTLTFSPHAMKVGEGVRHLQSKKPFKESVADFVLGLCAEVVKQNVGPIQ
jgi:hypothetical protein